MHLLQFLQKKGYSRRKILDLILQEQILLNKKKVKNLKEPLVVDDAIEYQGTEFIVKNEDFQEEDQILILFNKPKGVVVSKSDPHNKTIYEILPQEFQNFYYIGRLDRESRGLLLLTNSSSLVNQYEHPKFWIEKEYLITLTSEISDPDLQQMKKGISDEWEVLKFLDIQKKAHLLYQVRLNEGKKRHIRRVIKKMGYELLDLQRIKEWERELWDLAEWQRKRVK